MNAMVKGPLRDKGPCEVNYDGSSLGPYFESAAIRTTSESSDVFESVQGKTPVDSIMCGYGSTTVTVPFTRISLANLAIIIPGGSTSGSGVTAIPYTEVGRSEYDNSKVLILKPIVDGVADTDTSTWWYADHAYPNVDMEIVYDNEGQRVFNVVFKCFPDATSGMVYRSSTS